MSVKAVTSTTAISPTHAPSTVLQTTPSTEELTPTSSLVIENEIAVETTFSTDQTDDKEKSEIDLSYKSTPGGAHKKFKEKLIKLINENEEVILIVKKSISKDIEFIEIKKDQISKDQQQIHQSFEEIQSNRQQMIKDLNDNVTFEEKNLEDVTKDMSMGTVMEYEKDNCYIFFNETNQQIT